MTYSEHLSSITTARLSWAVKSAPHISRLPNLRTHSVYYWIGLMLVGSVRTGARLSSNRIVRSVK